MRGVRKKKTIMIADENKETSEIKKNGDEKNDRKAKRDRSEEETKRIGNENKITYKKMNKNKREKGTRMRKNER